MPDPATPRCQFKDRGSPRSAARSNASERETEIVRDPRSPRCRRRALCPRLFVVLPSQSWPTPRPHKKHTARVFSVSSPIAIYLPVGHDVFFFGVRGPDNESEWCARSVTNSVPKILDYITTSGWLSPGMGTFIFFFVGGQGRVRGGFWWVRSGWFRLRWRG